MTNTTSFPAKAALAVLIPACYLSMPVRADTWTQPPASPTGASLNTIYTNTTSTKVGIGVTAPASGTATPLKNSLDVKGTAAIGLGYATAFAAPANGLLVEGNVGIGTTTPVGPLHVSRSSASLATTDLNIARFGYRTTTAPNAGRSVELSVDFKGSMGDGWLGLREDRSSFDFMQVNLLSGTNKILFPNGNIGIGTATILPLTAKLNVDQNTASSEQILGLYANSKKMATLEGPDGGAAGYLGLFQKDITTPIIQFDARALSTKNSFINSGGFFGVGTNDPKALLNVKRDGTQANLVLVQGNAGGNATLKALTLSNTNSPNSGNLGQAIDQDFSMEGPSSVQYPAARFHAGKESDWTGSLANVDSYLGVSTTRDGITSEKVRISSDGKLGIGIIPSSKLDVSDASGNLTAPIFSTNIDYGTGVTGTWVANALSATFGANSGNGTLTGLQVSVSSPSLQKTYAAVFLGGKVGIGTSTPAAQLDVVGHAGIRVADLDNTGGILNLIADDRGAKIATGKGQGGDRDLRFVDRDFYRDDAETELMRLTKEGRLGLGTANPQVQLDVAGSANISGALTVASINTKVWSIAPDYVFEKGYKLASLEHVEKYVDEHKHLPDVPSAKDFKEKGVDLAEMNMKLLKKVEELTLYSIRQQKEIDTLKTEMKRLYPRGVRK